MKRVNPTCVSADVAGSRFAALAVLLTLLVACSSGENRAANHMERAEALLAEDRGKEALLELRSAAQLEPEDPGINLRVAEVSLEYGYLGDAVDFYREAHYLLPDDGEVTVKLARLLMVETPSEAKLLMDELVAKDRVDADVHLVLAELALLSNDSLVAKQHVEQARALRPEDPEIHWALARVEDAKIRHIRSQPGRRVHSPDTFEAALKAYEQYSLEGGQRRVLAMRARARILGGWPGHDAEALESYRSAIQLAMDEGTHHERILVLTDAKVFARATGNNTLLTHVLKHWAVVEPDNLGAWEELIGLSGTGQRDGRLRLYKQMLAANRDRPAAHVMFALWLAEKKGLADGVNHLRSRMDNGMDRVTLLTGIIRLQVRYDHAQDAAQTLRELQELDPDRPATSILLAQQELRAKDFDAAVQTLRKLVERADSADARRLLARAELRRKRHAEALQEVNRALVLDRGDVPETHRLKARILEASGDHRDVVMALKRLQRSRRLEPRDIVMMARAHYASNSGVIGRNLLIKLLSGPRATSQAALAFAELEGSNSAESERIYKFLQQAYKRDQKNFQLLAKLTSLDLEAQKVRAAGLRLNKAIQRSPKAAQIYLLRARVALSIGDFRSSRDDAERALRLSRSAHNEAIEILAYIYSQSPNPLATIESIEASAGPEGLSSNRLVLVARLYLKVGDEQKALATYERALAQGNDLTILKNDLAYLLAKVGKDYDRAIRLAREATRDPSEPLSAADTLGYVYLQSGEYDAALWQFRFVIATAEPPVAEYYYHMGLALLKLERLDEARTALERALVINPHFEEAADARTQLTVLPTDAGDAPGAS